MRKWRVLSPFVLAFLLVWASLALGDELGGKIRGIVSDPSGAVVPRAQIKATNIDTGISKEVEAQADGSYEFLQLQAPATYTISAQAPGFRTFEATGIHLSLNQIYVLNIALQVGTVTQAVTVEASPVQVESTSMQLGKTLTGSMIVDMPLNGRNWILLQQTLPGVVASDRFTDNFATNGSRSQTNDFLVNGIDANDITLNSPLIIPSPDAIGEVNMITNTINPEYGRNGGAIMNATVKSGANALHGDVFEFYRDNALNTRNFFSPAKTVFHRNQFGGTLGGPIKKEKAFFFFSFQGNKFRRPETISDYGPRTPGSATVFTVAERTGDFSADAPFSGSSPIALVGENGTTFPAGTPYSTIFPTNHIPQVDMNPISVNLMNKFVPPPNAGPNTFEFNPIFAERDYQYLTRIDYNLSSKDSIWGSLLIEPSHFTQDLAFFGGDLPGFGEADIEHTQQYALSWTHTFSGSMVNEARVGYNRNNFLSVEPQKPVLPSSLGFTGIVPQDSADAGAPKIDLFQGGLFTLGFSNNGPQPRITQTYQVGDNLSRVAGRHTLKFGIQMRRYQVYNPFQANNNGTFTYFASGTYTTGLAGADFLLGFPDSYLQSSGNVIDGRTQTYYSYAQDQFKLRPNLTLTYGTGWQVDTPLKDIRNGGLSVSCFRPDQQSTVFSTSPLGYVFPGDAGCNSAAGPTTHYTHFGPRFGFAWSPGTSGKWAIRGGYGIYFDRTEEELLLQNLTNPPFALTDAGIGDVGLLPSGIPASPSFAAPFTDVTGTYSTPNKYPFSVPKAGTKVDFSFFEPFSLNVVDRNLDVPYTQNYNLTIERKLPGAMILTAAYVGLQGRKLTNEIELNPAGSEAGNPICLATPGCNAVNNYATAPQSFRFPQVNASGVLVYGSVAQQATFINSNYNSFQLTLDKKPTHGLTLRATYAWSHSLDGSSSFEDLGFSGVRGLDPFNSAANYGDSAFDARQRFVVSYTYDLPSLRHFGSFERLPSRLTDGWRMTGIATLQKGIPVTVGDSTARSLTCDLSFEFYSCWDRPNTLGPVATFDPRTSRINNSLGGTILPRGPKDHYWFDPNAFGREPLGVMGNAGRNFFHGPGINNFDFGFYKDTRITEKTKMELRFEFFNLFNHAQFSINGPSGNSASSNFGRVLTAKNPNDSRIIQLAAKFYF